MRHTETVIEAQVGTGSGCSTQKFNVQTAVGGEKGV